MRVLLIEADPLVAGELARLLADDGHAATVAGSRAEGLALAEAAEWGAIVLGAFPPEATVPLPFEQRAAILRLASRAPLVLLAPEWWVDVPPADDVGAWEVIRRPFGGEGVLAALRRIGGHPQGGGRAHTMGSV